ncbi:AAA family ATPase [Vibrio splendidus]|nr:ATP-binding protein [Vibrio splendidus]MCC4882907.1 ATP-binding protein [Vibrio splendidus]
MDIKVIKRNIPEFKDQLLALGMTELAKGFSTNFYGSDNDRTNVKLSGSITLKSIEQLEIIANSLSDNIAAKECTKLRILIEQSDSAIIKSLTTFRKALEVYLCKGMTNGWLYELNDSGVFVPYLVTQIKQFKAVPSHNSPAHVQVTIEHNSPKNSGNRDRRKTVDFELQDVHGGTIPNILADKNYFKESQELHDNYHKQLELYEKYSPLIGHQFIGNGYASEAGRYGHDVHHLREDKLVNNEDNSTHREISQTTSSTVFNGSRISLNWLDEDDASINFDELIVDELKIPFHPWIKLFSLTLHENLWMLADEIRPYIYDDKVTDKLVLPAEHRDLVDVLIYDADVILDDIVSNKSGGTAILSKGGAGLGKTLTAEVYSEIVRKPLYSVHAGQLGVDAESIEKKLDSVLRNAEKWSAILLLDEADVFIRKRGNDLQHCAIVAAFLRKIERYNGILFMTTNREDDVDDAILSRCIAVISYSFPEGEELRSIWKVLSKHYGIELSDDLISELMGAFDKTSGRDIKEMLKLASKYKSQRNLEINLDIFRKCAMFRGLKMKNN